MKQATRGSAERRMSEGVARRVDRIQSGRRARDRDAWFGIGLFGVVGWSIAMPTVLGALAGAWLDRAWPLGFSWTLTGLGLGLLLGCVTAWRWVVGGYARVDACGEDPDA